MPGTRTSEQLVAAYAEASARLDTDALAELRHPDWKVLWPQSGEEVHSSEAFAEIVRNYPGGAARTEVTRVVGAEDRWVVSPGNTAVLVAGSGDFWWSEWQVTYPDGARYLCVDLIELRNDRIWRETVYWASPFEAPSWRSPWVEHGPAAS
jgi:hypothetical protein